MAHQRQTILQPELGDPRVIRDRPRALDEEHRAGTPSPGGVERRLEILDPFHVDVLKLQGESPGGAHHHRGGVATSPYAIDVPHDDDAGQAGNRFLEQLQALVEKRLDLTDGEPGEISARAGKARDAELLWIGRGDHDDRNGRRRGCRRTGCLGTRRKDHAHVGLHELGSQTGQLIGTLGPPAIDDESLSVDPAPFRE